VTISAGSRSGDLTNAWVERRRVMAESMMTIAFVHQLALRMQTDDKVAAAWLEATVETLYDTFKAGKGVTLTGLGGFYVQPRGKTWAFKFNPGQKLRALFGWSSSYKGPL
jgi:DNA-binding protein HU-beta